MHTAAPHHHTHDHDKARPSHYNNSTHTPYTPPHTTSHTHRRMTKHNRTAGKGKGGAFFNFCPTAQAHLSPDIFWIFLKGVSNIFSLDFL